MVPTEKTQRMSPPPADVADLIAGTEEADRGGGGVMTIEEFERWAETGEWPSERREQSG